MSAVAESIQRRPLTWPAAGRPRESAFERACCWVPVLGWIVGAIYWHVRSSPITTHIERQLATRPEIDEDSWVGDPARRRFARWLSKAIAENLYWPNDRLIADDPMEILCWAHEDGLDCGFLLQDIEAETGHRMTSNDAEHLYTLTLGEAVDYLLGFSLSDQLV